MNNKQVVEISRKFHVNLQFNMKLFFAWILDGIWQSAIISFVLFYIFGDGDIDFSGKTFGLWTFGIISYSTVVVTVTAKIISETRCQFPVNMSLNVKVLDMGKCHGHCGKCQYLVYLAGIHIRSYVSQCRVPVIWRFKYVLGWFPSNVNCHFLGVFSAFASGSAVASLHI